MKRLLLSLTAVSLGGAIAFADTTPIQPPVYPLQTVFVWAMGNDPVNIEKMELDLLEAVAKHGVAGISSSKIFPKGFPPATADILAGMRAQGCDSLVVLRRVSTIRWDTDSTGSSLKSFLGHRDWVMKPKNQVEAQSAAPIDVPNAYGNADWEISKGEVLVFDLKSEKLLWRGDSQVKTAKDLPQNVYYERVAEKVASILSTAGLIPPSKK